MATTYKRGNEIPTIDVALVTMEVSGQENEIALDTASTTLLVRLPLAYFMSIQPDANLTKIGLAAPVATVTGIILNVGFYIYLNRTENTPG